MRYNFPTAWRINKTSLSELAETLYRDEKWLRQLEGKIPSQYHTVLIPKKSGGERPLSVPSEQLKNVQRTILTSLFKFQFPDYVQGGVHARSIVTNALLHRKKKWVACLDISKFFPSVHHSQIKEVFLSLGCSKEVAETLTHFTSYDHELPQGAPTSPTIANLILYNLDVRIQKLCQMKRFTYSRYFDDITISGSRKLEATCDKVIEIARSEGFKIPKNNAEKFRIMPSSMRQAITGIIVNHKRLEPNEAFIADLERVLALLNAGGQPTADLYKILATARGMVSFLHSVNVPLSKQFERKVNQVNWARLGLIDPSETTL